MHTALVARLLKDRSAWELVHVPVENAAGEAKREAELASHVSESGRGAPALASA